MLRKLPAVAVFPTTYLIGYIPKSESIEKITDKEVNPGQQRG
jgi:hypothetical protein